MQICLGSICQRTRLSRGLQTCTAMPGSSSTASSRLPLGLPCNLRVGVPPADPPAVLLPRVLCHTPEALGLLPRVLCHTPGVRGLLLSPICSPCPNSHAWGRELGKGMSPVNSWGRSPRCPNSRTAISFLSCEDGKGEKKIAHWLLS